MQFHLQFESDTTQEEGHFTEYKVMLHPGEKIAEAVIGFKKILAEQCGSFKALHSVPHITLASFFLDTEREDLLLKYLDKFTASLTPFRVSINDFGFFDAVSNQGVAFLSIQNKEPIVQLQTNLNVVLKIDVRVQKKHLMRTAVPHITIGRGLNDEKLNKSKELFSDKKFASDFSVDKLVLLKRNDDKLLEVCKEFYFF
ncbi:MAG: RNA 2',3'-cyclic phosphodiesterase [Bacteroidia bacterium]|nr:RNA 2',3'-cyclic phosphodiesterase [Bacteroidia bacterium]